MPESGLAAGAAVVSAATSIVVAAYRSYEAGANPADVRAQAEAAGVALVTQIARIVDAGGKVIVATVPDVGATPYGRSRDVAGTALLTLSCRFRFVNCRGSGFVQVCWACSTTLRVQVPHPT